MNPLPNLDHLGESGGGDRPLRILWIGTGQLGSAGRPGEGETDRIRFHCAAGIEESLEAAEDMAAGGAAPDVIIVDPRDLPHPETVWLARLDEAMHGRDVILCLDSSTPLDLACRWAGRLRRPHLIIREQMARDLDALLDRIVAWRRQAGPAIESGALAHWQAEVARLTVQATIDPLTRLLRREEMLSRAEVERIRSGRTGQPMVLIMADIDHFKRVNDAFGHDAGDRALARVAALLSENRRPYDLVGRWGGEEFMILILGATREDGRRIAERLRVRVEGFAWTEESLPSITLSFGVAELHDGRHADFAGLIKAADTALYEAKRRGRNKVCVMDGAQPAA